MKDKSKSPLYRLRKSLKNLSINELSRELNVSNALLNNVENGIYRVLPRKFLENLEKAGYPFIDVFEKEYYKFIDNQDLFQKVDWKQVESL